MTQAEYEQLARSTLSFRDLDEATQAKILAATGEDRERYIKAFQEENAQIGQVYQDFQKNTDQVVVDYTIGIKQDRAAELREQEAADQEQSESSAEDLLNNI